MADTISPAGAGYAGDQGPAAASTLLEVNLTCGASPGHGWSGLLPWHSRRLTAASPHENTLHLQADFALTSRRNMLFGASGAGKTTLLRVLAGLLQPAQAKITLEGRTLTDTAAGVAVPAGHRGIGYVTQEPALFPHLNVEDNVAYGLNRLPREAQRARVAEILAAFSLQSLARRLPLRLSGGERQRVALARALALAPSLLLLDEPFSSLDASLRETTTAALDRFLRQGRIIALAVSHDVAEVYASDAEVLLLEEGRITAQGPSRKVLATHRERLLRQLEVRKG